MKKIIEVLSSLPDTAYIAIFLGVFLILSCATYFVAVDARLLEKKITAKQKDLYTVLQLKDEYQARKRASERAAAVQSEKKSASLSSVEDMVTKNFVGGKLVALRPGSGKGGKGAQESGIEVKVGGAPLGEVVSFLKAVEVSGYVVRKLQLALTTNQATLDVQVLLGEGRGHE